MDRSDCVETVLMSGWREHRGGVGQHAPSREPSRSLWSVSGRLASLRVPLPFGGPYIPPGELLVHTYAFRVHIY